MIRFSRRILAAAAVALAMAGGCSPLAPAQSPAGEGARLYPVRGVVLNRLTREPIARALVENIAAAVLTDGEGRFELDLPQGVTQISVRRPGYNSRGQESGHAVNVAANMAELTFTLTPEASITGHVALSTGESADGVTFLAYRRALVEGHELWTMGNSAATGSEGNFRMANLETPGLWILCSVPMEDHEALKAAGIPAPATFGYPTTCYPGPIPALLNRAPSNALALAPGQQADPEIILSRQPFYRVAISVPGAVGAGSIDVQIHDPSGRNLGFSPEWSFQTATAEVYLPPGQYYAEAHSLVSGTLRYGRIDFRVGAAPLTGLSMSLLPLHPIPVEIRKDFSANPQNGVQGSSQSGLARGQEGPGVNLTLVSADSAVGEPAGSALGQRPGSPSQYELANVVPGRYWVRAYAYEGYVASLTSGGTDLAREPLEIGPGNSALPVEIVLRNDVGQIQCTVTPPAPEDAASDASAGEIHAAYVYAIPAGQTAYQIPQTQGLIQASQPFNLPNLAPGTYRVVAYDQFQQINLNDTQQLAEIAAKGQTVTVTAGTTSPVQLDVIHAANPSPGEDTGPTD
jgi:hypothetical protein